MFLLRAFNQLLRKGSNVHVVNILIASNPRVTEKKTKYAFVRKSENAMGLFFNNENITATAETATCPF